MVSMRPVRHLKNLCQHRSTCARLPTRPPEALVTASQNDTMVGYWEPLKYVTKLRRIKTDSNPVLLKVDFHAGHGGASEKSKSMKEQAQHFAFMLDQLGVR
ncbi:unnamed protein product [Durusdinium trenchii]|uniref:Prolyl endopeptidase-like n=1 Tax=Durusdinium trenchii TaxID=1381693 RepID=A0ABP0KFZ9_9DINO